MAQYDVQSNGKAPSGLSKGDTVKTAGGTYQITGVKADGSYTSVKLPTQSTTTGGNKSGSSNKGTSNIVQTKDSYNGNFLSVDLNKDYQKEINYAQSSGDYATASRLEAERNAKINYLNSTNQNTYNATPTNNYSQVYTQSKGSGGAGTNNQGGTVYTSGYNKLSDLNDNWTSANINGAKYTRDNDGKIYINGYYHGDGYNANTNELTYSNQEDARKAAYDQYIMSGGFNNTNGMSQSDLYEYIKNNGLVDEGFVGALANGTSGSYSQAVIEDAKRQALEQKALARQQYIDDTVQRTPATAVVTTPTVPDLYDEDAYLLALQNRLNKGLTRRY